MFSLKNDIAKLGETVYNYDGTQEYKYIDVATLSLEDKENIINILEKKNLMPNNFLNLVCVTYLDHLLTIYKNMQKLKGNYIDNAYNVNLATWKEYQDNKFGIRIKQDVNNEDDKQVIFYVCKNLDLYDQFFLQKTLREKKYYLENLEFSLTPTKSSQKVKSTSSNGTNNNSNSIKTNKSQGFPIKFQKQKDIDKFVKGNVLEGEVCNYLRTKICSGKSNVELPNVFYTMRKIKKKGNDVISLFYNEFDAAFIVNESVELDKNIMRLNCKYEGNKCENSKDNNINNLNLKEKRIVFVECKYEENYQAAFGKTNLFKKIYSFRNLIDEVYGTKGYGITILYIYNNQFINGRDNYCEFVKYLSATFVKCDAEKMNVVRNYDIFSYYVCHNVYIYNYFNLNNELKEVKEELKKNNEKLDTTEIELKKTKNELKNTQDKLKRNDDELKNTQDKLKRTDDELKVTKIQLEELTKVVNSWMERQGKKNEELENAPTEGKK